MSNSNVICIRSKYESRLLNTKKYDKEELNEMSLVQLRALVDKEFPITITTICVTVTGGISRKKTVVKRRA